MLGSSLVEWSEARSNELLCHALRDMFSGSVRFPPLPGEKCLFVLVKGNHVSSGSIFTHAGIRLCGHCHRLCARNPPAGNIRVSSAWCFFRGCAPSVPTIGVFGVCSPLSLCMYDKTVVGCVCPPFSSDAKATVSGRLGSAMGPTRALCCGNTLPSLLCPIQACGPSCRWWRN